MTEWRDLDLSRFRLGTRFRLGKKIVGLRKGVNQTWKEWLETDADEKQKVFVGLKADGHETRTEIIVVRGIPNYQAPAPGKVAVS